MSGVDDRLERALHESPSPAEVETSRVFAAVAHKRRRRQLRRRALAGGLAVSVVLGAVVTGVIVTRDNGDDLRVATPATSAPASTLAPPPTVASQPADPDLARTDIETALPDVRVETIEFASSYYAVVTGLDRTGSQMTVRMQQKGEGWQPTPESVCILGGAVPEACARVIPPQIFMHDGVLTDLGTAAFGGVPLALDWSFDIAGYQQAPIVGDGERLWAATQGRQMRLKPGGRQVTFQGEILAFTPGGEVSWAVTRDFEVDADGTQYRLKRIVDDEPESHPIPVGEVPTGRPVSDGNAVWVPTVSGILRFDAATGEFEDEVQLSSTADARGAALVQGEAVITDGSRLARSDGSEIVDTGSTAPLVDVDATNNAVWAVSTTDAFGFTANLGSLEVRVPLPSGLSEVRVQVTDNDLVAVSGLTDLGTGLPAQVVVLLANDGSARTVVVAGGPDPASAVVGQQLIVASDGLLLSIPIG